MRIYRTENVYEMAKRRIRYLFNEFDKVVVSISGGKDSTVIFHLALEVAEELDKLPLTVMFVDQEIEWTSTIEVIRDIMYRPDVDPRWYQMPILLSNATSFENNFLHCWHPDEKDQWVREKEPIAITENIYGTERFHKLMKRIDAVDYPNQTVANLIGIRTEENPKRLMAVSAGKTYKWITWGRKSDGPHHYGFFPIYDWSYTDIWKYIHDNNLKYNSLYDYQYRMGIPVGKMRVSCPHHEDSVESLYYMQEVDPELWDKVSHRITGISTASKLQRDGFQPTRLPFMFRDWREYRDYLLDKLIPTEEHRKKLARQFELDEKQLKKHFPDHNPKEMFRAQINSILTYDLDAIKSKSLSTKLLIKRGIK